MGFLGGISGGIFEWDVWVGFLGGTFGTEMCTYLLGILIGVLINDPSITIAVNDFPLNPRQDDKMTTAAEKHEPMRLRSLKI